MNNRYKIQGAGSRVKSPDVKFPEMFLGYFLGPFGALLANGIFTSQLQRYFTDVLLLDLKFLSGLQLISTLLIVAANLIVGQLIERTKTLMGKARPWILLSALTISVSSVLIFVVPFQNEIARMVWIAVAYNLYYAAAFPIYNTANSTLISVSTRNSQQRASLASFANVAGLAVMGTGAMAFPVLASLFLKENQIRWFMVMAIIAVFAAFTICLQFMYTRERITEESAAVDSDSQKTAVSMKAQLKAVTSEKMWWLVILFYIGFQWSGALKNSSMAYFCQWVLDNSFFASYAADISSAWGMSQSLLAILGAIPMALAAAVVVPLARRFGKRQIACAGMIVGCIGGIIAGLGKDQMIPVAVGVALKCFGSAPACYLILAMLADVIDHIEFKNNIRTDGLVMSIYSALMVAGTPVCNAVFSAVLSISGYNQNAATEGITQSASVKTAISASYIWTETIAYAVCAVLIFLWTVEKKLPEEQAVIMARKE